MSEMERYAREILDLHETLSEDPFELDDYIALNVVAVKLANLILKGGSDG